MMRPLNRNRRETRPQDEPPYMRLRAFAFDPLLSRRIETHEINEVTIRLPWEDSLKVGPVDDYLEVVDYDPASHAFYVPVNLGDKHLLAQDGLPPSEGNPQFHQQMVYAVARTTINHFEQALGRRALWSPRLDELKQLETERKAGKISKEDYEKTKAKLQKSVEFVERLRIYPHALRESNAFYSPVKKALLFGYFPASITHPGENLPGGMVFTCLSHDIVAHETTHALLDGLHRRFIEPTNEDVWALHEAFADIVALFQHFSYPEVLRNQIARTRGNLERQNLLGELAYQFGQAIGRYGALRTAITKEPKPEEILRTTEPHERGAILVAAVFEAFLTIYKWRIADLLRIATGGTGVIPAGELPPDLVERLAMEASKTAGHILHMCIRALDYVPPVDVTFGDYLRALITGDKDYVADDKWSYRLAVIEAFRRRGIYPNNVRNLSEESLLWHQPNEQEQKAFRKVLGGPRALRQLVPDWGSTTDRRRIYECCKEAQGRLHKRILDSHESGHDMPFLVFDDTKDRRAYYRSLQGKPAIEVHSVRPASRVGLDGRTKTDLVVEITQRRRGYYDRKKQEEQDKREANWDPPDFILRGGCTLLIDPECGDVRYCIYKRIGPGASSSFSDGDDRLELQRRFLSECPDASVAAGFFDPRRTYFESVVEEEEKETPMLIEPFALVHRSYEPPQEVR